MQEEIDKEKEDGLGLPVAVTNDVAQQQMIGQVQTDQMVQQSQLMPEPAAAGGSSSGGGSSSSSSKAKSSGGSKSVKGDLSLEEVETTFTRLKRIL